MYKKIFLLGSVILCMLIFSCKSTQESSGNKTLSEQKRMIPWNKSYAIYKTKENGTEKTYKLPNETLKKIGFYTSEVITLTGELKHPTPWVDDDGVYHDAGTIENIERLVKKGERGTLIEIKGDSYEVSFDKEDDAFTLIFKPKSDGQFYLFGVGKVKKYPDGEKYTASTTSDCKLLFIKTKAWEKIITNIEAQGNDGK